MKKTVSRTGERLVHLLKTRGPKTTSALAEALDITVPAVRQHTAKLADEGAIVMAEIRGTVGRPAQCWSLTDVGHRRFPDRHAEATVDLIASIRDTLGEDALQAVIGDRYTAARGRYVARMGTRKKLVDRLQELVEIRAEEGYMPELVDEGDGYLLVENHCPICAAAQACQGFCHNELQLFREVIGEAASVERVEYLITGDRRCAYRVEPRP